MKQTVHMVSMLAGVALVSGLILVGMDRYSAPRIAYHQKVQTEKAVYAVVPDAASYTEIVRAEKTIYQVVDDAGAVRGYAFIAEGNGYQGLISIMVGMKPDLKEVSGIQILENAETPGLGGRITEDWFSSQFMGLIAEPVLSFVLNQEPENPNEIQAITGATISSRAVVGIINTELTKVRALLKS